mgnify:CR=1 FL=1
MFQYFEILKKTKIDIERLSSLDINLALYLRKEF